MLSGKSFAKSTDRKISWAANLFRIWRQKRIDEGTGEGEISWCDIDDSNLNPEVLSHVLPTFINEIKRVDGEDYPPNTVYSIIVMLQLFFEKRGKMWKLLDGSDFNNLHNTVDNIMKRRSMERIVQKMKRSEPITMTDEEEMWDFGILGEENPDSLHNTVMYLIGLMFALRGGKEHRSLHNPHFNPQIVVKVSEKSGHKYLLYTEDMVSKTNQGGLSGRKISPMVVKAFGNPNPQHDIIRLYQKYVNLCLPEPKSDTLYKEGCVSQTGDHVSSTVTNLSELTPCQRLSPTWWDRLVKKEISQITACESLQRQECLREQAVICSGKEIVPRPSKEFDIDNDVAPFATWSWYNWNSLHGVVMRSQKAEGNSSSYEDLFW